MRILNLIPLLISLGSTAQSSKDSLRKYVVKLSEQYVPRNAQHVENLDRSADYIREHFSRYTNRVVFQKYEIERVMYKNVLASLGPEKGYRIIVGANYDVHGNTPGADANASGVAALIELARLLSKVKKLPYRIDLVAFTLGDAEHAIRGNTGSYMHAKSLKAHRVKVLGMLSLHGIGFYTDVPHSQRYPFGYYKLLHGSRGNFISLYLHRKSGAFPKQIRTMFRQNAAGMKVVSFKPLRPLKQMSQGDQENYISMGFPAVKISNTNAYRNNYYHYDVDSYETLDYDRMSRVVNMIYETLKQYKR